MPEALIAALRALGIGAISGVKANPAGFIVRTSRGLYWVSASSIAFFWYTGWRRERVPKGSGKFPIPGISKLTAQFPASLTNADLPQGDDTTVGAANPNPLNPAVNPPGSKTQPGSKHESFDPVRYTHRFHTAQKIANRFHLSITSGHRTASHNAEVGGVPGSLHVDGLAFDFVGSPTDMARAQSWAEGQTSIFSEVLVHNVGSGLHLHLGFWPNAGL